MKKAISNNRQNKGFTLIELLVVVAIITLLSGVVMASVTEARGKANNTKQLADYRSIVSALIQFKQDHGYYPASSTEACFGSYASGGCIKANSSPITPDSTINNALKSYLSSHDFVSTPSVVVDENYGFAIKYIGFLFKCSDSGVSYGSCKKIRITFPAIKNSKSCPTILNDNPLNEVPGFTGYTICTMDLQ